MNCHVCGKKIVAGYALCGGCGHAIGNGIEKTRLGYFVEHPEEFAKILANGADVAFCANRQECMDMLDRDGDIPDEDCTKCALDWLMEVVK